MNEFPPDGECEELAKLAYETFQKETYHYGRWDKLTEGEQSVWKIVVSAVIRKFSGE
jgi:hypothetical protein